MGTVMIRCSRTGKAVSTGIYIDHVAFDSMRLIEVVRRIRNARSGI
jgi:hypothetical protein